MQLGLLSILAAGVDPTFLYHVEAGIKAYDLTDLLDNLGQMLEAGGASGQTIAGMMSTSTHSADSLVRPFVDYVRAIHLVGAGGIEHWLEPDAGITDPAKLQAVYPRLAAGNIHYDTRLFNAVLVSAGSMGVIYSVIIKTVPQYGVHQHRVATTWESLLAADPDLTKVIDGTYLASRSQIPPEIDVLGNPILMSAPFTPNTFSQVVINPYPLYGNDATLTPQEQIHIGEHLCFVTNRVEIPVPATPYNPGSSDSIQSMGEQMGRAARNALGFNVLDYDVRFLSFQNSLTGVTDVNITAPALVEFLANNFDPRTISAVIHFVLKKILPVEERFAVNLSEVIVWNDTIKSFCVEAAFTVSDALAFVPKVLALVASYAARNPRVYIGGYLALRFVGKKTDALLGMQRWSPTCCVEYLGLAGSRGIDEFADDLQKLALASGGILHFGLQNNVMTAADMLNAFGPDNIAVFRRARGILSKNGSLTTFDNTFTDRLGLSALPALPDQVWHSEQTAIGVSARWTNWYELSNPGNRAKALALAAHPDGRMHAVFVGLNDQVFHSEQTAVGISAAWTGWEALHLGNLAKALALAAHPDGRMHAMFVGTNDQVFHSEQTAVGISAAWTGWEALHPGNRAKALALAAHPDGRMHAVFVGLNDQVFHSEQTAVGISAAWTGWEALHLGNLAKALALAAHPDGRMHAMFVGTNDQVFHSEQTAVGISAAWTGWEALHLGNLAKALALAAHPDGRMHAMFVGTNDQVFHSEQTAVGVSAAWTGWEALHLDNGAKALALAAHPDGRMRVVLVGLDDQVFHNEQTAVVVSAAWTDWQALYPGNRAKALALAAHPDGRMHAVMVGT